MIGIIAAVSLNGVFGQNNKIPWYYPEDYQHFKNMTINSTVIMGRKTYESIGKPLPKRRNIVISSSNFDRIETFSNIESAIEVVEEPISLEANVDCNGNYIEKQTKNIWLIGGKSIFEYGIYTKLADVIYLTVVPLIIKEDNSTIKFPWINPLDYKYDSSFKLNDESELKCLIYRKL